MSRWLMSVDVWLQLPEGFPPVLQSRSIPAAVPQPPPAYLDANRQLVPLGWKSFQALAQAQAAAVAQQQGHMPPGYSLPALPYPLLPPPPGLTSPHLPQLPTSDGAYSMTITFPACSNVRYRGFCCGVNLAICMLVILSNGSHD